MGFGRQLLQAGVLSLQIASALKFGDTHAAVFTAPFVERGFRDAALAAALRKPILRSCCRSQPCKVCEAQPILTAIDSMAEHYDGHSLGLSNTMHTERSRISREDVMGFFMAPFSQELEPPPNPGRFKTDQCDG